jgi:hypothetical protein
VRCNVITFEIPIPGFPDKSENVSQINLKYVLGYISDISKIYLGCECIRDTSWIYPRCIPDIGIADLSNIPNLSRIYPGFILDNRFIPDSSVYPAYIWDSKAGG